MLGLLDHDVLSSIEVPYLPERYASLLDPEREGNFEAFVAAKREADKFDMDIFEFKSLDVQPSSGNRTSSVSITGVTPTPSIRIADKRTAVQHGTSQPPSKIHRIEERVFANPQCREEASGGLVIGCFNSRFEYIPFSSFHSLHSLRCLDFVRPR